MKSKNLSLLVGGLLLLLAGSQLPYLAVDFDLRETIWNTAWLRAAIPALKAIGAVLPLIGALACLFTVSGPVSRRLARSLLVLVLAYSLVPLSMNSAMLTLTMVTGLGGFLLAVKGLGSLSGLRDRGAASSLATAWRWLRTRSRWRFDLVLFLGGLALNLLVAGFVFGFRPGIIDTLDQVFQARIFLNGELVAPAPPVPRAFEFLYMIIQGDKWYSQYPPGHPLMLALGLAVDAAWLVGPVLGALIPVLLHAIGRTIWGARTGRAAGLLGLVAPYVHLMAGSHMSHTTCAFFLTLGALGLFRLLRGGGVDAAITAGIGFGYALWTRPYAGLAVSLAAGLGFLWATRNGGRLRRLGLLPAAAIVACAPVALLLVYNQLTNGHPLLFGYNITQGPLHKLGFGLRRMNEMVREFTLWEAIKQTGYHLNGVNVFALGAAVPGVLLVPWTFLSGRRHPFDWVVLAMAIAPIAAFFIYPFTDFVLGPRLVFSSVPFGLLLVARSLIRMRRAWPRNWRRFCQPRTVVLLFLPVIPAFAGALSFNQRLMRVGYDRVSDFLAPHHLENALVLCDNSVFGHYGFAQLRPGLPADLPVFCRDVNSAELVRRFPDRPIRRLGYTEGDRLSLDRHEEPVIDLYDAVAEGRTELESNRGMRYAIHTLDLGRIRNERHKLLYGFATPAVARFRIRVPTHAYLRFSSIVHPKAWARGSDGVTFRIRVESTGATEPMTLYSRSLGPEDPPFSLLDQEVDLRRFAGQSVRMWIEVLPGSAADATGDIFDISNLRVVRRIPS